MSGNVQNVKVEAMNVIYGEDTEQIETITLRADVVKADLAGKYFHLYANNGANVITKHVLWFQVSGVNTAPSLTDATLTEVDIELTTDTPTAIATALASAIDALTTAFNATSSVNVVTVTHEEIGYAPSAHDSKDLTKLTNFGFGITTQGDTEDELGCVEGDIEVAFEESFIDINCHAEGATPVGQLKNGVSSVEVTLNILETTKAQMKKMFTKSGGSFTPDGGTEVFGMGTFKNFENMFKYATKLRLHPVRLLDGDRSEDFTFHKAMPNLTGLTFSGENPFNIPVTFKIYPASGIDKRVNYFSIGDGTQSLA